jgi:hypothetical protein
MPAPVLSAATVVEITSTTARPRVTVTFGPGPNALTLDNDLLSLDADALTLE